MSSKVKIGVIGCGFFAQNHLHAWRDLAPEGAVLAAVCDVDPAKSKAAAAKFGCASFTSYEDMIKVAKPDLVDVITRMDTHRDICAHLAEHKIAAIVQKPLAPTWDDCVAMANTARKHGTFLAIHENFRFQTPMLRVKELLDQGVVGDINWARIAFRTGFDVFSNQPYLYDEERLVIQDVGIHVLDLARVFIGEVETISCETQKRNARVRADDTATMLLRHKSGAVSVIECTYMAKRYPDLFPHSRLEIEGTKGSLILNTDDDIILSDGKSNTLIKVDNPAGGWIEKPWHVIQQSVLETNRHILKAFQQGKTAGTDIEDNLKTFALVEAAYIAAKSQRSEKPIAWKNT